MAADARTNDARDRPDVDARGNDAGPRLRDARTKIVATLGPASEPPAVLDAMLRAGVAVVRLNLSHCTVARHIERIGLVRAAGEPTGRVVAVLADLPGRKVRAASFPDGVTVLAAGTTLRMVPADAQRAASSRDEICVEYPTLLHDLEVGDKVVIGDGAISLQVQRVDDQAVTALVLTGGQTQGCPGVHLPGHRLRLTTPTDEDLAMAEVMVGQGVDFLAVSFVRAADDLRKVRAAIAPSTVRLVAKIETLGAVDSLTEITAEADAIMVARGDLGIECPLED